MSFIDFTNGEVLTADQMDTTFRQTVMRFADASARDTALSGVLAEGMMCYLDDTDEVLKYSGSSWINIQNNPLADFVVDATTTRTLTSSDSGKTIRFTSGSDITVTVDASTDFAVGARVDIIADGAGELTVTASTATVAGDATSTTSGSFLIGGQYSVASLLCVATDEYRLIGNITAV